MYHDSESDLTRSRPKLLLDIKEHGQPYCHLLSRIRNLSTSVCVRFVNYGVPAIYLRLCHIGLVHSNCKGTDTLWHSPKQLASSVPGNAGW
jgi:hypothetical protein